MKYTHILVDLDGTVSDFDYAEKAGFSALCKEFNIEINDAMYEFYKEANARRWKEYESGLCSKEDILVLRFSDFAERYNIDADTKAMSERYMHLLVANTRLYPNAKETLIKLREKYKVDLVTNGTKAAQYGKLSLTGTRDLFDNLFISEDIGYPKPKREFFDYIFNRYKDVPKEEFIVVGDSLTADIKGANLSGLDSILVKNGRSCDLTEISPTYTVESFEDVYSFIEKL